MEFCSHQFCDVIDDDGSSRASVVHRSQRVELKGGKRYLDLAVFQQPPGQTDGWVDKDSPLRPRVHRNANPFTVIRVLLYQWNLGCMNIQFNSKASDTVLRLPHDVGGPILVSIFTVSLRFPVFCPILTFVFFQIRDRKYGQRNLLMMATKFLHFNLPSDLRFGGALICSEVYNHKQINFSDKAGDRLIFHSEHMWCKLQHAHTHTHNFPIFWPLNSKWIILFHAWSWQRNDCVRANC